jgi:hypothetical protein
MIEAVTIHQERVFTSLLLMAQYSAIRNSGIYGASAGHLSFANRKQSFNVTREASIKRTLVLIPNEIISETGISYFFIQRLSCDIIMYGMGTYTIPVISNPMTMTLVLQFDNISYCRKNHERFLGMLSFLQCSNDKKDKN